MAMVISQEIREILKKETTTKVLVTTNEKNQIHAVVKNSLQVYENDTLLYFELLESSQANKNMVRSLWFDGSITFMIVGENGESYQIKAKPVKSVVSGYLFQTYYKQIRDKLGDVDLAAVWILEPQKIMNQTFVVRRQEEELNRPYFKHLDRLAKY